MLFISFGADMPWYLRSRQYMYFLGDLPLVGSPLGACLFQSLSLWSSILKLEYLRIFLKLAPPKLTGPRTIAMPFYIIEAMRAGVNKSK